MLGVVTESYSDTVPAGIVIAQAPAAGALAAPGSAVDLEVSKGSAPPGDRAVPDLSGMMELEAEAALVAAELTLGMAAEQYSAVVPVGRVVGQNPAAGAMVAPGTPVNILVSKGPEPVAVPDVAGMTQTDAEAALTGAGLLVGTVTEAFSAVVPAGQVVSQNPAAGVSVLPGAAVALTVSRGVQPATVPNVAGMTQTAAGAAIGAAGLALGTVTEAFSAAVPAGQIISQSPAAGTEAAPGSAVDVVVSEGPAPVGVPNTVGMTQAAAGAVVGAAGLTLGAVTEVFSATVPAGQVVSQSPEAGADAAPGSAVALVVSKGVQPGTVPNVAGMTQAAAGAAVGAAGLTLGAVTEVFSETVAAGRVISQRPAAGPEGAAGFAVDLTVSMGADPAAAGAARGVLGEAFSQADTDGTLSFAEGQAVLPSLSQAVFDLLDTNGDGALGRDELGIADEGGCGGCACAKDALTPGGLKARLGDLFLGGMALALLAALGGARRD